MFTVFSAIRQPVFYRVLPNLLRNGKTSVKGTLAMQRSERERERVECMHRELGSGVLRSACKRLAQCSWRASCCIFHVRHCSRRLNFATILYHRGSRKVGSREHISSPARCHSCLSFSAEAPSPSGIAKKSGVLRSSGPDPSRSAYSELDSE